MLIDTDGDTLNITAVCPIGAMAAVVAKKSKLTSAEGTPKITVVAEDSDGNWVSDAF